MALTVENHFPPRIYQISDGSVHVHEGGTNTGPTNVIDAGQPAFVHFRFKQSGWLSKAALGAHFHFDFYAEKMGPGDGPAFPTAISSWKQGDGQTYHATVNLAGMAPGVYHCTGAVSMYFGSHITPVHMMEDVGIIRVVGRSV